MVKLRHAAESNNGGGGGPEDSRNALARANVRNLTNKEDINLLAILPANARAHISTSSRSQAACVFLCAVVWVTTTPSTDVAVLTNVCDSAQ